MVTTFPESNSAGADCIVQAANCKEVLACNKYFLVDRRIERLPECGSDLTSRCEGNVFKQCLTNDSVTWYESSYDCTLAGATCIVGEKGDGTPWADCQGPLELCDGHGTTSYCDGTRAVLCAETGYGYQSPWAFDCAEAFDSVCAGEGNQVRCEGPNVP